MIKINMFQSGYGDCFLVRLPATATATATAARGTNLLIDLGFCYKTILVELKEVLGKDRIDRFIITHFDSDHIQGACSLLAENGNSSDPCHLEIEQIWLNSFRHLQFFTRTDEEISDFLKKRLDAYIAEKDHSATKEGDVSAAQASLLAAQIYKNSYMWNTDADRKAICVENMETVMLPNDVKLTVITPTEENLKKQEKRFITDLRKMGLIPNHDDIFDDAFELYIKELEDKQEAQEKDVSCRNKELSIETILECTNGEGYQKDDGIGNGGSISFVLEKGNKKLLFLADAYAEDVINGLKAIFKNEEEYPIYFDAIKVSHHGSYRNNPPELYKFIDSERFLFSTNGKHPKHTHPDIETIACIINRDLPKNISKRILHFNYELEHLEGLNNEELKEKYNYDLKLGTEIEIL
ncbi:hypothetical protein ACOIYK_000720 [Vibrio parahaemolyticus]|uniref:hypothetical protein n=1 Tax=Vibrio parahaemolyticus TaxID=670 RepID=UPI0022B360FD|nr:hypothetical protein [Vibrio parahaemolyticus]MCZ6287779.1 hypothetical protein [Vibrio parahaemolyticus]